MVSLLSTFSALPKRGAPTGQGAAVRDAYGTPGLVPSRGKLPRASGTHGTQEADIRVPVCEVRHGCGIPWPMSTQRLTGLPARASAACISSRSIEPSPGVRVRVRVRVRVCSSERASRPSARSERVESACGVPGLGLGLGLGSGLELVLGLRVRVGVRVRVGSG